MNNTLEKINYIYRKMQDSPNQLSILLPQIYSIALECKDYEGFCVLFCWEKPLSNNKGGNISQYSEANKMLLASGLNIEDIRKLREESFEKYLKMRYIEGDKVCALSAREMEESFARMDNMLSATDVPKELHPVDLYFRSEAATNQKLSILQSRQIIEKQYAILQGFITSKLAYYEILTSRKIRRSEMEKRVKNSKKIFIIHGHSEAKRRELVSLLRDRFQLEPVVLSEQPDQGLTIIEKFEKYAAECVYAFALFTPDDIVSNGGKQYFQARPNVIFELGWFYANLGRSRVCILDQASEQSQIFSDLQGVMRMQFQNSISEKIIEIERELESVGIIQ